MPLPWSTTRGDASFYRTGSLVVIAATLKSVPGILTLVDTSTRIQYNLSRDTGPIFNVNDALGAELATVASRFGQGTSPADCTLTPTPTFGDSRSGCSTRSGGADRIRGQGTGHLTSHLVI